MSWKYFWLRSDMRWGAKSTLISRLSSIAIMAATVSQERASTETVFLCLVEEADLFPLTTFSAHESGSHVCANINQPPPLPPGRSTRTVMDPVRRTPHISRTGSPSIASLDHWTTERLFPAGLTLEPRFAGNLFSTSSGAFFNLGMTRSLIMKTFMSENL